MSVNFTLRLLSVRPRILAYGYKCLRTHIFHLIAGLKVENPCSFESLDPKLLSHLHPIYIAQCS
jgi:hypothetical protein